ncbi:uncharacterized protein RSE6_13700 [Rhynchosporium secalis]|uniref:AB hydrolase-1 domain-containing protein n=1 Tax=Rhynchosporium secalis TaxID=38038 RepID=A0A1E1MTF7_RHYSE|nr:uncharacterized protein RSE6_13700 [Rhynchosporium secalis]
MVLIILKYASLSAAVLVGVYASLLGMLSKSFCQAHVVYLHGLQMTWFKDLNVPELFGFLHNQVSPFSITTLDGETLYAWHILPLGLYRKHEAALVAEPLGFALDITSRLSFRLLRNDPEARLVIHFHGAGGTGLINDALAVIEWATTVAGISPSKIIFAQSMGTASPPVVFAGTILVAPFVDVGTLVSTYKIAGTIPLLTPIARFPSAFAYLRSLISDKWLSKDRIAGYVTANEANGESYKLTIMHAEDDWDIPYHHSQLLFWHAVNATASQELSYEDLEVQKYKAKVNLGAAGSVMEWQTEVGIIREEILQTGLHDVIMGYPVITMAVMRMFEAVDHA